MPERFDIDVTVDVLMIWGQSNLRLTFGIFLTKVKRRLAPPQLLRRPSIFRNPHYHRSSDTMEKLDYWLMAELVETETGSDN